ncbi:MAG: NAD(P)H-binding protein [Verrucomicrobiota bacterium]
MRILVTTPAGFIGQKLLPELLAPEFSVRVVVSHPTCLPAKLRRQVDVVSGSLDDLATLQRALVGVEALFWCVPHPIPSETHPLRQYERSATTAAEAIRRAGTARVVTISAGGKGHAGQAGPITGLHLMEDILNGSGASIRHLRCGVWMENFLAEAAPLRQRGILAYPMPGDVPIPMVAATDIADAALKWLVRRDWHGIEPRAVHGPEDLSYDEAAAILERALDFAIEYRELSPNAYAQSLLQSGASREYARSIVEMFNQLGQGITRAEPRTSESTTATRLSPWAQRELRPLLPPGASSDHPTSFATV